MTTDRQTPTQSDLIETLAKDIHNAKVSLVLKVEDTIRIDIPEIDVKMWHYGKHPCALPELSAELMRLRDKHLIYSGVFECTLRESGQVLIQQIRGSHNDERRLIRLYDACDEVLRKLNSDLALMLSRWIPLKDINMSYFTRGLETCMNMHFDAFKPGSDKIKQLAAGKLLEVRYLPIQALGSFGTNVETILCQEVENYELNPQGYPPTRIGYRYDSSSQPIAHLQGHTPVPNTVYVMTAFSGVIGQVMCDALDERARTWIERFMPRIQHEELQRRYEETQKRLAMFPIEKPDSDD